MNRHSLYLSLVALIAMPYATAEAFEIRPAFRMRDAAAAPGGSPGYSPAQIKEAYGISDIPQTGQGQTIAIIDAFGSPTLAADVANFSQAFGLPAANITVVNPAGPVTGSDAGWAQETTLDVEWAHAIAPNARILVLATPGSDSQAFEAAIKYAGQNAAALGIGQVSMSWGGSEFPNEASLDPIFNISGVTFIASAGDSGMGVQWPAVSPHVLGVGGTHLVLTGAGAIASETAWVDSGGGTSAFVAQPAFQQGLQSTGKRTVPDVAYDGDPNTGVLVYFRGSWFEIGGTSAGAPQWAGLLALANSGRSTPIPEIHSALYALAATSPGTYFNDVSSGCDGTARTACATTGYDFVTGLGSPKADRIIPALIAGSAAAPAPTVTATPKPSPTPSPTITATPSPTPTSRPIRRRRW